MAASTPLEAKTKPAKVKPAPEAVPSVAKSLNPLLPPQVPTDGLFLELTLAQKLPAMAPQGFVPLYSAADWQSYRQRFGQEADELVRKRASAHLEFANKLIGAAQEASATPGLRRLLLTRAAIISYRNREGYAVASRALEAYRAVMDLNTPSHVAALWSMADAMGRYITTPKPERVKCSALAAKANIQLAMLLVDTGQLDAAQKTIAMLVRHETAVRADRILKAQAAAARANVGQTIVMMEYLGGQVKALNGGDATAAMPLYLYARFVRPNPSLLNEILARRGSSAVGQLHSQLAAADGDPVAFYAVGDLLKGIAAGLPDGVLKSRTLYAAMQAYRLFLHDPKTEDQRVKRTLARMAMQSVASDGARPNPVIRPFDPPPAATAPATRAATPPAARPGRTPVEAPPAPTTPRTPASPSTPALPSDPDPRAVG